MGTFYKRVICVFQISSNHAYSNGVTKFKLKAKKMIDFTLSNALYSGKSVDTLWASWIKYSISFLFLVELMKGSIYYFKIIVDSEKDCLI